MDLTSYYPENRIEMHLHTKMSDDISVISVGEVFGKADMLGLKAVAFTNMDNVQDFPEIMRYADKNDHLKVIYGAELKYKRDAAAPIYKLTLLAKNQVGIKELYKVISSISETDGVKLIDLQALKENRKNLLVGSCGAAGELYDLINEEKSADNIAAFYDYFELFPSKNNKEDQINKQIFSLGEELGVPVVAASNGHYIDKKDKICLDIVSEAEGKKCPDAESCYLRTTKEMLEEFSYH